MYITFPLQTDSRGRTAESNYDDHIREMIEQMLFTNPGERVNRPDFGSGLQQLIFAPNSSELATAMQFSLQAALQRWLGDVIEILLLNVTSEDSTLRIDIQYIVRRTNQRATTQFVRTL